MNAGYISKLYTHEGISDKKYFKENWFPTEVYEHLLGNVLSAGGMIRKIHGQRVEKG